MDYSHNYVPFHVHTYYSLLDSCTSPKDYIKRAVELDMNTFGFSEHGNIFNWGEKMKLCEENGIKYLHGIEVYITEQLEPKVKDNWHTILIAKNYEGFKEINNLFFKSYQPDHMYHKHRITAEEFLNISDNVIKISACIQSPLWQLRKSIMADTEQSNRQERMELYIKMAKHYDYYEIQYHTFPDNLEYTKLLYKMSQMYDKPLIAGTDTHSLNKYKAECRTLLQYGKTENAWGDSENECDLIFKTYDELVEMFRLQGVLPEDVYLQAIENTNVMADSCEVITIDKKDKYPYLYGEDDEKVMWETIKRNYKDKLDKGIISNDPAYIDAIKEEMAVFKKVNMVGFMLFMSEMMSWARGQHIATGFSRGSVSGSTVAFITNITDVDPIKWHTIFSRFCNEHRVEAGDIDTDWYEDDRPNIYNYIINRFGKGKTGYILALGKLQDKNTIATICRGLKKRDKNNAYDQEHMEYIKAEYTNNPDLAREKYPEVFYYFDGMNECVVSQSQHPAGIVASPVNLIDFCGAFLGTDGQQILPLDMDECHHIGLIKYDILGLKTVGVIDKVCKMIGKHFPSAYEIDFDDQMVYDDMTQNPATIFQFESEYAQSCFKKMECHSIEDITLVNAALRPSGDSYRDRLFRHEVYDNGSEIINEVLKESYGYIAFQEEVTAFLQYVCGFSGSDADSIRRAIGKKQRDKIEEAMPQILDGYCSKSDKPREIAEEEAKKFLKVIEDSGDYMFNKNHALGYSLLTYLCGYYRHYYPVEYCTAYLMCANNDDDIANGISLAQSLGIEIINIQFRHSDWDYTYNPSTKQIYRGLSSIPYMSKGAVASLKTLYSTEYGSFTDLLKDLVSVKVKSNQIEILVKMNFFAEFGSIEYLLTCLYAFKKFKTRKKCFELVEDAMKLVPYKAKTPIYDLIKYEFEATNMVTSVYPSLKDYYFVTEIKGGQYSLYELATGKHVKYKIRKKTLQTYSSLEIGDIIKILEIKPEGRFYKDVNDEWQQSTENFEDVVKKYSKVIIKA